MPAEDVSLDKCKTLISKLKLNGNFEDFENSKWIYLMLAILTKLKNEKNVLF